MFTAALAGCGGAATPAPVARPAPVSTTCVPAGFAPEEARADARSVTVCDTVSCVVADLATGTWAAAPFETVGVEGVPWSRVDGALEICDGADRCVTVPGVDDSVDVRSAAYDPARRRVAYTTRDDTLTVVTLDGGARESVPGVGGIVEWVGETLRVEGELFRVGPIRTLATIGGDEPWSTILTQAHAAGPVWVFGDGVGLVVFQDVVTGDVRERIELPMSTVIGPLRTEDAVVVVAAGGDVVVLSPEGDVRARLAPPICPDET